MEDQPLTKLFEVLPTIMWIVLAAIVFILLRRTIEGNVLPRLTGAKGPGFELSFQAASELDAAIAGRKKELDARKVTVSEADRRGALGRAERHTGFLQGARILWVDDRPEGNRRERKLLHSFGITIDLADNTDEALAKLARAEYDLVITDMKRNDDTKAGSILIERMWTRRLYRWTIIYLTMLDPSLGTPPRAFGITDRPDHLLHYVIDIMERERS